MKRFTFVLIGFLNILQIDAHAALIEPPARNVMWRTGFDNLPYHPDDDYLICQETGAPGCPPCGDSMDAFIPRSHEAGGKWATGIITRTYLVGQVIDVFVNVTISHGGFVEFKLCPNNNTHLPVKQQCLDQYPLHLLGKSTSKAKLRAHYGDTEEIKVKVKLPAGLTCSQCVLQMSQVAEQFLPSYVMFRNCADISIEERPIRDDVIGFQRDHVEFHPRKFE